MVRQKTISLDETTAIIAGRMENFSGWVRSQLRAWARSADGGLGNNTSGRLIVHKAPPQARVWGELKDKCNPRHKAGVCKECYPEEVE